MLSHKQTRTNMLICRVYIHIAMTVTLQYSITSLAIQIWNRTTLKTIQYRLQITVILYTTFKMGVLLDIEKVIYTVLTVLYSRLQYIYVMENIRGSKYGFKCRLYLWIILGESYRRYIYYLAKGIIWLSVVTSLR